MRCFELTINGQKKAIAGLPGDGVLSLIISYRKGKGAEGAAEEECSLKLGGLDSTTDEFVDWADGDVEVGDEFVLRFVEQVTADAPTTRRTSKEAGADTLSVQRLQLAHFERMVERTKASIRKLEAGSADPD